MVHCYLEEGAHGDVRLRKTSSPDVRLQRREHQLGQRKGRVTRVAHGDEFLLLDAGFDMLVVLPLLGDSRGACKRAIVGAVIMAHEETKMFGQCENLENGAVELAGVAAGRVGA